MALSPLFSPPGAPRTTGAAAPRLPFGPPATASSNPFSAQRLSAVGFKEFDQQAKAESDYDNDLIRQESARQRLVMQQQKQQEAQAKAQQAAADKAAKAAEAERQKGLGLEVTRANLALSQIPTPLTTAQRAKIEKDAAQKEAGLGRTAAATLAASVRENPKINETDDGSILPNFMDPWAKPTPDAQALQDKANNLENPDYKPTPQDLEEFRKVKPEAFAEVDSLKTALEADNAAREAKRAADTHLARAKAIKAGMSPEEADAMLATAPKAETAIQAESLVVKQHETNAARAQADMDRINARAQELAAEAQAGVSADRVASLNAERQQIAVDLELKAGSLKAEQDKAAAAKAALETRRKAALETSIKPKTAVVPVESAIKAAKALPDGSFETAVPENLEALAENGKKVYWTDPKQDPAKAPTPEVRAAKTAEANERIKTITETSKKISDDVAAIQKRIQERSDLTPEKAQAEYDAALDSYEEQHKAQQEGLSTHLNNAMRDFKEGSIDADTLNAIFHAANQPETGVEAFKEQKADLDKQDEHVAALTKTILGNQAEDPGLSGEAVALSGRIAKNAEIYDSWLNRDDSALTGGEASSVDAIGEAAGNELARDRQKLDALRESSKAKLAAELTKRGVPAEDQPALIARAQLEAAQQSISTLGQSVTAKGGVAKWAGSKMPFAGGLVAFNAVKPFMETALKLESGEKASQEELDALSEYLRFTGREQTWGALVGDIVSALPGFMVELQATGGLMTMARAGVNKSAAALVKKFAGKEGRDLLVQAIEDQTSKAAGQWAKKSIGHKLALSGIKRSTRALAELARLPVASGARIVENYATNSATQGIGLDEQEGRIVAVLDKDERHGAKLRALDAVVDSYIENLSEGMGGSFAKLAPKALGKAYKDLAASTKQKLLSMSLVKAMVKANPGIPANKIANFLKGAQWDGILPEMLEERAGEVMRAGYSKATTGESGYQLPTAKQLSAEFVSFMLPGGVSAIQTHRQFKKIDGALQTSDIESAAHLGSVYADTAGTAKRLSDATGAAITPEDVTQASKLIGAIEQADSIKDGDKMQLDLLGKAETAMQDGDFEKAFNLKQMALQLSRQRGEMADREVLRGVNASRQIADIHAQADQMEEAAKIEADPDAQESMLQGVEVARMMANRASGMVKIARGLDAELTTAETEALKAKKDPKLNPDGPALGKDNLLLQPAIDRLKKIAPAAAEFISSEQDTLARRAKVTQQAGAASAPSATPSAQPPAPAAGNAAPGGFGGSSPSGAANPPANQQPAPETGKMWRVTGNAGTVVEIPQAEAATEADARAMAVKKGSPYQLPGVERAQYVEPVEAPSPSGTAKPAVNDGKPASKKWAWQGLTQEGTETSGEVEAATEAEAIASVRSQGHYPVSIQAAGATVNQPPAQTGAAPADNAGQPVNPPVNRRETIAKHVEAAIEGKKGIFTGGIELVSDLGRRAALFSENGKPRLAIDIGRFDAETKDLEGDALKQEVEKVIQEEWIHAGTVLVRTPKQAAKFWNSLTPELQKGTEDSYTYGTGFKGMTDPAKGYEAYRMFTQWAIDGKITENTNIPASVADEIKAFLREFGQWLTKQLSGLPKAQRDSIKRDIRAIKKALGILEAKTSKAKTSNPAKGATKGGADSGTDASTGTTETGASPPASAAGESVPPATQNASRVDQAANEAATSPPDAEKLLGPVPDAARPLMVNGWEFAHFIKADGSFFLKKGKAFKHFNADGTPFKEGAPPVKQTTADKVSNDTAPETLESLTADHKARVAAITKMETDPEIRGKKLKAEGMQFAARKRELTDTQTPKEKKEKARKDASNFTGKRVSVGGRNATVVRTGYGRVRVKFEDDGTEKAFPADQIKPELNQVNNPFDPVSQEPLAADKVKELRDALAQVRRWAGERMVVGYEMRIDDYERGTWTLQKFPGPAETLNDLKAEITKQKSKWAMNHLEELGEERVALVDALAADSEVMDVLNNPSNSSLIYDFLGKKASDHLTEKLMKSADLGRFGLVYDYFKEKIENEQWVESIARDIRKRETPPQTVKPEQSKPAPKAAAPAPKAPATLRKKLKDTKEKARGIAGAVEDMRVNSPEAAKQMQAEADALWKQADEIQAQIDAIENPQDARENLPGDNDPRPETSEPEDPKQTDPQNVAYIEAQAGMREALKGLFSPNRLERAMDTEKGAGGIEQLPVPEERTEGILKASRAVIKAGIRTPEALAKFLDDTFPGGKVRAYAESIWDIMGIVDKSLRGTHDWTAVFNSLDQASEWAEFDITEPLPGEFKPLSRDDMPQVPIAERDNLLSYLHGLGIDPKAETVSASTLKPAQREYSTVKVARSRQHTQKRAIIVSSDNFIVDGHHQYVAADGGAVPVLRLNVGIEEAINAVRAFPGAVAKKKDGTVYETEEYQYLGEAKEDWRKSDDPEAAIVNPIDPDLSPDEKVDALRKLSNENIPVIEAIIADLSKNEGLKGKYSRKNADRIQAKASRPSIRAKSPWHDVEHVRDGLRFKVVLDHFDKIEAITETLHKHGVKVIKFDHKKMFTPKEWGWRFVAWDIQMPNGQLVEFYAPLPALSRKEVKHTNHLLFEKWRNLSADDIRANPSTLDAYTADVEESAARYGAAFAEDLKRMGYADEAAALASWNSFVARAESLIREKSSINSAAEAKPGLQTPEADLRNDSPPAQTTISPLSASDALTESSFSTPEDTTEQQQNQEVWRSVGQQEANVLHGAQVRDRETGKPLGKLGRVKHTMGGIIAAVSNPKGRRRLDSLEILIPSTTVENENPPTSRGGVSRPATTDGLRAGDDQSPSGKAGKTGDGAQGASSKGTGAGSERAGSERAGQPAGSGRSDGGDRGGNGTAGDAETVRPGGVEEVRGGAGNNIAGVRGQPPIIPTPEKLEDRNHRIDAGEKVAPRSVNAKIDANFKAIELLRTLEKEERNPNAEERAILEQYTGWGFIKEAFNTVRRARYEKLKAKEERYYGDKWEEHVVEDEDREVVSWFHRYAAIQDRLKAAFGEKEFLQAEKSVRNAHYTTPVVLGGMWDAVKRLGFRGGKAVEPGGGAGHAIGTIPDDLANRTRWEAVELDGITARLLAKLYPQVRVNGESAKPGREVRGQGFQDARIPNNSVDLFFSNVPFAKEGPGKSRSEFGIQFNLHNYFFARALAKTKPGGIIAFITSANTMESSRDQRAWLSQRAEFVGAIRLPNTAFKENAGTEVVTDIIFLRKPDGTNPMGTVETWLDTTEVGQGPVVHKRLQIPKGYKKEAEPLHEWFSRAGNDWIPEDENLREAWEKWRGRGKPKSGEAWKELMKAANEHLGDSTKMTFLAPIRVNEYFARHPEMVLGTHALAGSMYRPGEYTVLPKEGDLGEQMAAAIKNLPENIAGNAETNTTQEVEAESGAREFSYVERDGVVYQNTKDGMEPVEWRELPGMSKAEKTAARTKLKKFRHFAKVRGILERLITAEANPAATDEELAPLRAELNTAYDAAFADYGGFSKAKRNPYAFLEDDPDYYNVQALDTETVTTNDKGETVSNFTKSDIFKKRLIPPYEPPTSANSLEEAVAVSMAWEGRLNAKYVADLLGITEDVAKKQLLEQGMGFENPATGMIETEDEYLSGAVGQKLKQASEAAIDDPKYNANVAALRAALPARKPISQASVAAGQRWIPDSIYNAFARSLGFEDVDVSFDRTLNRYEVKGRHVDKAWSVNADWGPVEILEAILNHRTLNVTRWDSVARKRVRDTDLTALLEGKAREMKDAFVSYVKSSQDTVPDPNNPSVMQPVSVVAEEEFNDKVNSIVPPTYKGDWITLPNSAVGADGKPIIWLKPFRKAVLARFITEGRGMMAHGVGSGKTYNQIALAMELRRLGKARKPLMVVQGSTINQVAASFKKAYPNAKILVATPRSYSGAARKRFTARIATGDWDAVIMTHANIGMIPNKQSAIESYYAGELDELNRALEAVESRSDAESDLLAARDTLMENRAKGIDQMAKYQDNSLSWEDLGIDALIVDEAHAFKNAPVVTMRGREVKNIPTTGAGALKAVSMMMKTASVRERGKGKGVFFATGTPVSNTMAEAFIMMRYIAPDILAANNIYNFDDFANQYGDVKTTPEATWNGTVKSVDRFAKFINGGPLVNMIRSVFDVALGNENLGINVPDVKGGKPRSIIVEPSEGNQIFNDWILAEVGPAWKQITREDIENNPQLTAVPIMTMQAGIAAALDPRMIHDHAPDDPNSKVNAAIREVLRIHKEGAARKTSQVIFADLFNPFNMRILEEFAGNPFGHLGENPLRKGAKINKETGEFPRGNFHLGTDIKEKLVKAGVPASEVYVVTDETDEKLTAILDKVNSGEIRVVIGSTQKLGVGVNMQERLAAAHHLMPPRDFKPAMMEQRNGRIIRQGNLHSDWRDLIFVDTVEKLGKTKFDSTDAEGNPITADKLAKTARDWLRENDKDGKIEARAKKAGQKFDVEIIEYSVGKSLDSAIYSMMAAKAGMIGQVLSNHGVADEFDDPTDELAFNFAENAANIIGDANLIRFVTLDRQSNDLRALYNGWRSRKSQLEADERNYAYTIAVQKDKLKEHEGYAAKLAGIWEENEGDAVWTLGDSFTVDTSKTGKDDPKITATAERWMQQEESAREAADQKARTANFTVNGRKFAISFEGVNGDGEIAGRIGFGHSDFNTTYAGTKSFLAAVHSITREIARSPGELRESIKWRENALEQTSKALKADKGFPDLEKLRAMEAERDSLRGHIDEATNLAVEAAVARRAALQSGKVVKRGKGGRATALASDMLLDVERRKRGMFRQRDKLRDILDTADKRIAEVKERREKLRESGFGLEDTSPKRLAIDEQLSKLDDRLAQLQKLQTNASGKLHEIETVAKGYSGRLSASARPMADDMREQEKWLDEQARKSGFADVEQLAQSSDPEDVALLERLAAKWRSREGSIMLGSSDRSPGSKHWSKEMNYANIEDRQELWFSIAPTNPGVGGDTRIVRQGAIDEASQWASGHTSAIIAEPAIGGREVVVKGLKQRPLWDDRSSERISMEKFTIWADKNNLPLTVPLKKGAPDGIRKWFKTFGFADESDGSMRREVNKKRVADLEKRTRQPVSLGSSIRPSEKIAQPEDARNYTAFWIDRSGTAFQVMDHLKGARDAQQTSDEWDSRKVWGYKDMWKRGFARVSIEPGDVRVQSGEGNTTTGPQNKWLKDAVVYLETKYDKTYRVMRGMNMLSSSNREADGYRLPMPLAASQPNFPGETRLYRASIAGNAKEFNSFTDELPTAIAYTRNPGFGGPNIYAFDVDTSRTLETGSLASLERALLPIIDPKVKGWLRENGYNSLVEAWEDRRWHSVPEVIENFWGPQGWNLEDDLRPKFDWVHTQDSYPNGASVYILLKQVALNGVEAQKIPAAEISSSEDSESAKTSFNGAAAGSETIPPQTQPSVNPNLNPTGAEGRALLGVNNRLGVDDPTFQAALDELTPLPAAESERINKLAGFDYELLTQDQAAQAAAIKREGVKQFWSETRDRETHRAWNQWARDTFNKDPEAAITRIVYEARNGFTGHSGQQAKLAMLVLEHLSAKAALSGDAQMMRDVEAITLAFDLRSTLAGREIAARWQPHATMEEQHRTTIAKAIYGPTAETRAKLDAAMSRASKNARIAELEAQVADLLAKAKKRMAKQAKTADDKAAHKADVAKLSKLRADLKAAQEAKTEAEIMAEQNKTRLEEVQKAFEAAGFTLEEVMVDRAARLKLQGSGLMRRVLETFNPRERIAIRAIMEGKTDRAASTESGISRTKIGEIEARFDAALDREVDHWIDRGFSPADMDRPDFAEFMDAKGGLFSPARPTLTPEERTKLRQSWKNTIHPPAAVRNNPARKKFKPSKAGGKAGIDIGKPEHAIVALRAIQRAENNAFDMMYEYWINGILSGPATHVANIAGNTANVILEYGMRAFIEAPMNVVFRDMKGATFSEFNTMRKWALGAAVSAFEQARKAWSYEVSSFDWDATGEQPRLDSLSKDQKTGYLNRTAIPGRFGRIVRAPSRALLFMDEFTKYFVGVIEASAQAHRIAKADGLTGEALDDRVAELVRVPGSPAWVLALEKAHEMTFQQDLPKLLADAQNWLNKKDASKTTNAVRWALKFIFPFIKTPYNILAVGVRKTPLGTLNMARKAVSGAYKGNGAGFQHDLAEQVLAWAAMVAIAGMAEGDPDDDKKTILITGTRGRDDRSEASLLNRSKGGETTILYKGKPVFHYGRYAPLATSLATVINAFREMKKVPHGKSKLAAAGSMLADFVNTARSQTFLQGFDGLASFMASLSRESEGTEAQKMAKFLAQGVMPNLIRQPLRNTDDQVRDTKNAPWYYHMVPVGDIAEPLYDLYGRPVKKGGSALSRLLISEPTDVPAVAPGDKLLNRWNTLHPVSGEGDNTSYFPSDLTKSAFRFKDAAGKWKDMTPAEIREVRRRVGQQIGAEAASIGTLPIQENIDALKKARGSALEKVKKEMFAGGSRPAVKAAPSLRELLLGR